jgi:hypothetical protein
MKRESDLKYAGGWVICHGLIYIINALNSIYSKKAFRFGENVYSNNLWYIGIVFGLILIFAGIGLLRRNENAYKSAVLIYKFLILQKIAIWFFMLFTIGFDFVFTVIMIIFLIVDLILLKIVKNTRSEIRCK